MESPTGSGGIPIPSRYSFIITPYGLMEPTLNRGNLQASPSVQEQFTQYLHGPLASGRLLMLLPRSETCMSRQICCTSKRQASIFSLLSRLTKYLLIINNVLENDSRRLLHARGSSENGGHVLEAP